jgi:hypothetical protein
MFLKVHSIDFLATLYLQDYIYSCARPEDSESIGLTSTLPDETKTKPIKRTLTYTASRKQHTPRDKGSKVARRDIQNAEQCH